MTLSQYAPWFAFGFMFGAFIWGTCFCFNAIRRSMAVGAGFYDV